MFNQNNEGIMFGCIYLILTSLHSFSMHLSTSYTTPPPLGLIKAASKNTCSNFIRSLFYIHKMIFLILCIVHIGTTPVHVYTCFLLSSFLHSQFSLLCLQALVLLSSQSSWSQHGGMAAFCRCIETILYCHLVELEVIPSSQFE